MLLLASKRELGLDAMAVKGDGLLPACNGLIVAMLAPPQPTDLGKYGGAFFCTHQCRQCPFQGRTAVVFFMRHTTQKR